MKSCDEMVNSLFERRDNYIAEQRKKRRIIARRITSLCCVCIAVILALAVRQSGIPDKTPSIIENNPTSAGENDRNDGDVLNTDTSPQSSETNNNVSGSNSSDTENVDSGNYPNNYCPGGNEKIIISSYESAGLPSASYLAPKNGKVYFSVPLQRAMDEYGDSVLYRVTIHLFSGEVQLASDSSQVKEECERLSDSGYTVAYETFFDGESSHYYFTLHASYEELVSFNINNDYGYFIFLYDEPIETT